MKVDISKNYKTKAGEEVTLVSDQGRGKYPILGYAGALEHICTWTLEGEFHTDGSYPERNLVEVPKTHVIYLNVYPHPTLCSGYSSREHADNSAVPSRLARIRVEFEEGRFDA